MKQDVIVRKLYVEYITRSLNVCNAAFPKQVDEVDFFNADIADTVELGFVPEHSIYARTGFQFVLPHLTVCTFKICLIEYNGDDRCEHFRLSLVPLFARKDIRGGEVVHGIGMLVCNAVKQPCRRWLNVMLFITHAFPMTELVPLLVIYDPAFKVGFPLLVLLQDLVCVLYLLFADDLRDSVKSVHRTVRRHTLTTYLRLQLFHRNVIGGCLLRRGLPSCHLLIVGWLFADDLCLLFSVE